MQVQLERLVADVAHQAAPTVDKVAYNIKGMPVFGVPGSEADAAVGAGQQVGFSHVDEAPDDEPAQPPVVVGFPAAHPHRSPLRFNGLHGGHPIHGRIAHRELRVVRVLHGRETGQRLRVLDVEGLRRVVVAVDQQHVATVVDFVEHVHHHVKAGGQRVADVVGAEVLLDAEIFHSVARKPAPQERNVAQVELEPIGLFTRAAGRIGKAAAGARNGIRQSLQRHLVDVGHLRIQRHRPVLQVLDDVGRALKADKRIDAAAIGVVLVRLGDMEQVLL